jgi:hypothetical protein
MPVDALPQPHPVAVPGTVTYRHEYRDALGRPLRGTVTLTGRTGIVLDGLTVLPAPVPGGLVGGVLEVDLPPDTYRLEGVLRTAEGVRVTVRDEITLETA